MTVYEATKTLLLPNLSAWESHVITIVFTTVLATVVAYFVCRKLTALTRQSQARSLRAEQIVEHAAEGILTINQRGQVLSLNPAAEKFFGYPAAEVLHEPITLFLADPPSRERQQLLNDTMPAGTILGLAAGAREVVGKRKNGETFPLELTGSSMTVGDETISIAFTRDISKRKRAQRYLIAHYAATCILAEARTLAEALPRLLQSICDALGWEAGAYWRVDQDTGVLRCTDVYQAPSVALPELPGDEPLTCKPQECLVGRVWSTGQPAWVEDLRAGQDCAGQDCAGQDCARRGLADPLRLQGAFAFPIMLDQEACGVLSFFASRKFKRDEQLQDILAALGNQLGQFIARKRDEEMLQRNEERFRQLAENIHEVFWMADARDERVLYLSPSYEEVWGRPCPRFGDRGQAFLDLVHAEDRARMEGVTEKQRGGERTSEEYRIVRPDGSVRWVWDRAFPIRDSSGQVYRIAGITADITDRRRIEEALRESETRLRSVMQAADDAIVSADSQGRIIGWNHGAERMFGYDEGETLGQPFTALILGRYHGDLLRRFERAGASEVSAPSGGTVEIHGRRKTGEEFPLELSLAHWETEKGRFFTSIMRDVTERKRLEDQFRQAQKMEAVGQLAGGVAHDFNNLLTVISGYCEILLGAPESGQTAREMLEQIHKAGERAASLTRQLLAFGRKQILQVQVLDLNVVIQDLGKMLRRLIGEDVNMVFRLAPVLGRVKADRSQIEQILMNLAANARDAMPGGGTLTIITSDVDPDSSTSWLPPDVAPGPFVLFTVGDTGCGMDEATKTRVFEPFFTTKEIGKGTGLGLATVYGIVKQSGGHIDVESRPGRGATFRIYLPRLEHTVQNPAYPNGNASVPRGKETVLLVEDEDKVRKFVHHALRLNGYTVLEARSGPEALQLCKDHPGGIDLLVTDVIMPEMNGRQLAEEAALLRENLKVLFISGYTDRVWGDNRILNPETAFLPKPITPAVLARKVREVLDAPVNHGQLAGVA
jgi:PAS domain S-box-containing protein